MGRILLTSDRLRFAESVLDSWRSLDADGRAAARAALSRIEDDPISGVPLADPVKGYWSAREGHVRVIYRLVPQSGAVVVLRLTIVEEDTPS